MNTATWCSDIFFESKYCNLGDVSEISTFSGTPYLSVKIMCCAESLEPCRNDDTDEGIKVEWQE